MQTKTINIRLTLDVQYQPGDESPEDLANMLRNTFASKLSNRDSLLSELVEGDRSIPLQGWACDTNVVEEGAEKDKEDDDLAIRGYEKKALVYRREDAETMQSLAEASGDNRLAASIGDVLEGYYNDHSFSRGDQLELVKCVAKSKDKESLKRLAVASRKGMFLHQVMETARGIMPLQCYDLKRHAQLSSLNPFGVRTALVKWLLRGVKIKSYEPTSFMADAWRK